MAGIQEYLDNRSDDELRGMLASYCRGAANLTPDSVLQICSTLAERDPELPDPYELWFSLCRMFT